MMPLETDLNTCKLEGFAPDDVIPALKRLELQHFVNRLSKLQASFGGESDYKPYVKAEEVPAEFEDEELAFFTAEETDAPEAKEITTACSVRSKRSPQVCYRLPLAELVCRDSKGR